jgi:hypothetical protein
MLAVGSATGGQVRLRIGGDRVQQRGCVERTQQRKHQDGGKAAHLAGSLHAVRAERQWEVVIGTDFAGRCPVTIGLCSVTVTEFR